MDCDGASSDGRAAWNAIIDRAVRRPDTPDETALCRGPRTLARTRRRICVAGLAPRAEGNRGNSGPLAAAAYQRRSVCGVPGGAARGELAVAAGRALGGFRRERSGKIQFSQIAIRRFVSGTGWENRARGVSRRHADL